MPAAKRQNEVVLPDDCPPHKRQKLLNLDKNGKKEIENEINDSKEDFDLEYMNNNQNGHNSNNGNENSNVKEKGKRDDTEKELEKEETKENEGLLLIDSLLKYSNKDKNFHFILTNYKVGRNNLNTGTLVSSIKKYTVHDINVLMFDSNNNNNGVIVKLKSIPMFSYLPMNNDLKSYFENLSEKEKCKQKENVMKEIKLLVNAKPLVQLRSSFAFNDKNGLLKCPSLDNDDNKNNNNKKNNNKNKNNNNNMGKYMPSVILSTKCKNDVLYCIEFWCQKFTKEERRTMKCFDILTVDMSKYILNDLNKEGYFNDMYLIISSIHTSIETVYAPTYLCPKSIRENDTIKYDFESQSVIALSYENCNHFVKEITEKLEKCINHDFST